MQPVIALGRRINHDPRSRQYSARRGVQIQTVLWNHAAHVLDQGYSNSCTGHALTQLLNTTRFAGARPKRRYFTSQTAYQLYSTATHIDEFPWVWEPDDEGSSAVGVCKAGVRAGYLAEYRHAFGLEHLLAALQIQPVLVGTDWYQGMTFPGADRIATPTGELLGGHEYVCLGASMREQTLAFLNSWGPDWPIRNGKGRFRIRFTDFATLLADDGDITVPIGR